MNIEDRSSNAIQRPRSRNSCPRFGIVSCEYTIPSDRICSFPDSVILPYASENQNYTTNFLKLNIFECQILIAINLQKYR